MAGLPARRTPGRKANMTEIDAWTAGFFEGEGCLLINKKGNTTLEVEQVDPSPLYRLQKHWGGTVRKRVTRNAWRWTLTNESAVNHLLLCTEPHMTGTKAMQARTALSFIQKGGVIEVARRSLSALKGTLRG